MARNGLFPGILPDEFSIFQHPPRVRVEKVLAITGERKITFHCQCSIFQFNCITSFTRYTRSGRIVILRFMDYILPILIGFDALTLELPHLCSRWYWSWRALEMIEVRFHGQGRQSGKCHRFFFGKLVKTLLCLPHFNRCNNKDNIRKMVTHGDSVLLAYWPQLLAVI